jgi:hypothetical protein
MGSITQYMTFEVNGSDALERQLVTETELAAIFNASEESVYLYLDNTVEIKREVVEEEKEVYVPRTASQSIETASDCTSSYK